MSKQQRRPREDESNDASFRGQRLEALFLEELNSILDCEVTDPRLEDVRITRVELSRDGSRARVWFALRAGLLVGDDLARETGVAFARAAGFLRVRLCDALPLKRMPQLRFCHDPSADFEVEAEQSAS